MENDLKGFQSMEEKLAYICKAFRVEGEIIKYRLIPSGHINTTYYVALYDGYEIRQYLVQMVNWFVFKEPETMMNNIELITRHVMLKQQTMERRRRLHFHHTAEGKNFIWLGEGETREFWRLSNFVENSVSFDESGGNRELLRMSGKAFGNFERQMDGFDASQLVESIPHFHDTRYRLETLFAHVAEDPLGRVAQVRPAIDIIERNRAFACTLCEMIDRGELPIRVTHNDTKTNNVLFDKWTLDPLVVIDLDTCMPGLVCYDFGDTVRFAGTLGREDDTDLTRMKLDLGLFRAFTEGYVGETASMLTDAELGSLANGACIMTLELASRFLDDYITGDQYFRIDYPMHNLVRTWSQLALFEDMMLHRGEMEAIVHEVAGR